MTTHRGVPISLCGHAPHPDACPASIRTTTRPDQQRPCTARKDLA